MKGQNDNDRTHGLPQTTIGDLREMLSLIGTGHDKTIVKVWLPGSTISLVPGNLIKRDGCWCLEGNVDPGSALSVE